MSHPTIFERNVRPDSWIADSLKNSQLRPFWPDDAPEIPKFGRLNEEATADLVVVGGGFLGLWTALLAKEREPGLRVVMLEQARVGWAASGRNGGFCESSLTHGEENGKRRWPDEFDALEALGAENLDAIEETLTRYQIDCDFERTGLLVVAVEDYQAVQLDFPGRLTREEVQKELNSPTYLGGQWFKDGTAMLHPGKLVAGLARVVGDLGVEIFEDTPATGISELGGRVEVRTPSATLHCDRVVLATNAFPSLLRRYRYHSIPVYDYVLMSEPLTAGQLDSIGWKNRQGVSDMANQFHYYRLTKDNRILFGGYDAVYHFGGKVDPAYEDRPGSYRRLASHFFTTFPQLEGLRFSHRWAGAIDTSTRFCAFFGSAMKQRVVYAAGFTGLGVGATRFAAQVLLDKAFGLDTERTRLKMVREMPMPFPP